MASGSPYDVKNTPSQFTARARSRLEQRKKKVHSFLRGKSADSVLSSEKSEIVCESFIIEMDGGEKESRRNQCLRGKSADSVLSSEKSEIICESFIIDTQRKTRRKMEKNNAPCFHRRTSGMETTTTVMAVSREFK